MSLLFSGGGTNNVSHGTLGGTLTKISWCGWIYPTSLVAGRAIIGKSGAVGGNPIEVRHDTATDELDVLYRSSTVDLTYTTSNANITTNKWWFVAVSIDTAGADNERAQAVVGSLTATAAECTYGTTDEPTGTLETPAGNFRVGNNGVADEGFGGRIATSMVWPGVALTAAELIKHQFAQVPMVAGCKVFSHYGWNGTGTQPDWSGNGNSGTVTGATVAAHVPLGPAFGYDVDSGLYTVAAAGGDAVPQCWTQYRPRRAA